MLQADKSILTFPISKRLFAYLFGSEVGLRHYPNLQIDSEAFGDLKATIVNDSLLFGIGNEGGSEVIVVLIAHSDSQMTVSGDSGTTIPPDDFVYTPSAVAEDSSAPRGRAFFRKPARGSGHGHRGGAASRAPTRGNHNNAANRAPNRGNQDHAANKTPTRGSHDSGANRTPNHGNRGGKPSRGGSRGGRGGRGGH